MNPLAASPAGQGRKGRLATWKGIKVYTGVAGYSAGTERVELYDSCPGYRGWASEDTGAAPGKRPTAGRVRAMRWGRGR